MIDNAPERLVSGSDDFTMFLWESDVRKHPSKGPDANKGSNESEVPIMSKHPKARMTGHQQVRKSFLHSLVESLN